MVLPIIYGIALVITTITGCVSGYVEFEGDAGGDSKDGKDNTNKCKSFDKLFHPNESEELVSIKNEHANLPENIDVYFDTEISQEERDFVISELSDALNFSSAFADRLGLTRYTDKLEVFYRPKIVQEQDTLANNYTGGTAHANQIELTPVYLSSEGFTSLDNESRNGLYSIAVHEMTHVATWPRIGADAGRIISEGLAVYAQCSAYNTDSAFIPNLYCTSQTFPEETAKPLVSIEIDETTQTQIEDSNGQEYNLKVLNILRGSDSTHVMMEINDQVYNAFSDGLVCKNGYCTYLLKEDEKLRLLLFNEEDAVLKTLLINDDNLTQSNTNYATSKVMRGEDGFGNTIIMKEKPNVSRTLSHSLTRRTPNPVSANEYFAAYLLVTGLEQLLWENYPEKDPDSVIKTFGEIVEDTRLYKQFSTNPYSELCTRLELPKDQCNDLFTKMGLEPSVQFAVPTALCMPE